MNWSFWLRLGGTFLAFFSYTAFSADSYLVLFHQNEIAISSLGHEGYQNLLKSTNQKDLKELEKWMGTHRISGNVEDLWLVRGARLDLEKTDAETLKKQPWVGHVLADQVRQFVIPAGPAEPEDPPAQMPWGLQRIGVDKIRAEFPALDGTGIRVGILDTGIQSRHPEFRRVSPEGKVSYVKVTFRDFVAKLKNSFDDHGHGTHVAGTIAGANVGIAPNASLLVGKVFTANGTSADSTLIRGMQWAFDPDGDPSTADYPHIVSNSWGAALANGVNTIENYAPFRLAIQAWINGGIIPVFAAGNSGTTPNGMPGGLPEPISVGAIDSKSDLAPFSSVGPNLWKVGSWILTVFKPDLSAPGVDVTASLPGNKYAAWSGTSMATPHVAGALALMLHANHKLTVADAKKLLLQSSEKKMDIRYGWGILNAYQLVKLAQARR